MAEEQKRNSQAQSTPITTAGGWGLRYPGLVMSAGGRNEVKEFLGMWGLKPDADLVQFTETLSRDVPIWEGPYKNFTETTIKLGLIRSARWFVARTQDFEGYTLFFVSQFDGALDKYFDDFVLNGKENLLKIWGQCVGCPSGEGTTAHDVVAYIAKGQIKTLACYEVVPSLSISQIYKAADWYKKTQNFQRAVADPNGDLEDKVNEFFRELAQPYSPVQAAAMIDTEVGKQWQYEDVPEHILGKKRAA